MENKEQEFLVTMDTLKKVIDSIQMNSGKNERVYGFSCVYRTLVSLPKPIQKRICNQDDSILYYLVEKSFANKTYIEEIAMTINIFNLAEKCIETENLIHMKLMNEVIPQHLLTINKRSVNSLVGDLITSIWLSNRLSNFIKLDKLLEYDTTNHFKKLVMKINLEKK